MAFIKQLEVAAYVDENHLPTCAINFGTGKICPFLRIKEGPAGMNETCIFDKHAETLQRRETKKFYVTKESLAPTYSYGTVIPGDFCPIWRNDVGAVITDKKITSENFIQKARL